MIEKMIKFWEKEFELYTDLRSYFVEIRVDIDESKDN